MFYSSQASNGMTGRVAGISAFPTQIERCVPISSGEENRMKTEDSKHTRIDQLEQGNWLYVMLGEAREDVARQPSPAAVKRIRARLEDDMDERSDQAAA